MASSPNGLTVAVTGPTGTFGLGLLPLLQADPRIARVVGVARRPFEPAAYGWTKLTYRQGDVRDPEVLAEVFRGADVVVHLAFVIAGMAAPGTIRRINVAGTLHAFDAARAVGARRFVYASSVAAYGFHRDNPVGMTEDWPVRPADRLFYAREKAELERLLAARARAGGAPQLYLLRPALVVGPHTVGAKGVVPGSLGSLVRGLSQRARRLPVRVPVLVPALPMQLVHEADVGAALLLCVVGAGSPGAYNIAGAGRVSAVDIARELGLLPIPLPAAPAHAMARAAAAVPLPFLPPALQWVEALSAPVLVDTSRAVRELGWVPRYTGIEALRAALEVVR